MLFIRFIVFIHYPPFFLAINAAHTFSQHASENEMVALLYINLISKKLKQREGLRVE
jgi:hypothetical protein